MPPSALPPCPFGLFRTKNFEAGGIDALEETCRGTGTSQLFLFQGR
jgi:hypothetical protein